MATPRETVQRILQCDAETAESVVRHLAAVVTHKETREFLAIYGFTARTTVGDPNTDMRVAEGRRQIVMFCAACARMAGDIVELGAIEAKETRHDDDNDPATEP